MPPCGRRRPTHPGAWTPSSLDGGRGSSVGFQGSGPDNLDVDCKASLQKLLKPSNYGAIDIWMRNHGTKDKKGILLLAEAAVGDNGVPVQQDQAFNAAKQAVQLNPKGRHRVANSIHVTADRQQVDLSRVRCGEDQRDKDLIRRRNHLANFVPVHSTDTVSDYYRLGDVPVSAEPGAKVLTEDARRGLTRWQIRGPEQNRENTAQICQALRSIGSAVDAVPRYTDNLRIRKSGSQGCIDCLFEYSGVKQATKNGNYERRLPMSQPGQHLARSMPTLPPAYIHPDEIRNITRPGGYVVDLLDCEPLACKKNKQRNITTKLAQGGACSWSTSYGAMSLKPAP